MGEDTPVNVSFWPLQQQFRFADVCACIGRSDLTLGAVRPPSLLQ